MDIKKGFPPIAEKDAVALILGSMPGDESLRKNQYYANPRNAFWRIMGGMLGFDHGLSYRERIDVIKRNNIALWDVMVSCERQGSLDTAIINETIVENDFISFYNKHPDIRHVFFNGSKAEKEYLKRVIPRLYGIRHRIKYYRLPSTSPAMGRLSFNEKMMHRQQIGCKIGSVRPGSCIEKSRAIRHKMAHFQK